MKLLRLNKKQGYALLMVMAIVGVAALVAASTMQRTYSVAKLNQRSKQFQGSMYAAEAAVEKVYARFRYDYVTGGDAGISNSMAANLYQDMIPTAAENSHWANYQFWNAQGVNNKTYIGLISNKVYQVLDGSYAGLNGWRGVYRVVSNARPLTGTEQVAAGVQQEVAIDTIPAFQYAIFYNGQLEFTQCAPLTVRGRTHANGKICLGAASGNVLRFEGLVTTASSIVYSNMAGYSGFATPVYAGTPSPGYKTGQPTLQLPIGTNNTAAAVREIINPPPAGESITSLMGQQRYYNKASLVLIVSNTTVSLMVKNQGTSSGTITNISYNSASPSAVERTNLVRAFPFLTITNKFRDYRESKWVMPTEINMSLLRYWLPTNAHVLSYYPAGSGSYPNIMYIDDNRTITNLHAVRVHTATVIPTNGTSAAQATGFTLATQNPLYVWGHFNTPNTGHRGTTNTTATFPASLVSDAITILSESWTDNVYGNGSTALSSRNAVNTTVNAAILSGVVYTTGSGVGQWSGGVHNQTRLLENWSGDTLTLNTSLVNLYNSAQATAQFQNPGNYYNAPTRNFNFDRNFLSQYDLPPGTPMISVISRYKWTTTPINTVTYNGP